MKNLVLVLLLLPLFALAGHDQGGGAPPDWRVVVIENFKANDTFETETLVNVQSVIVRDEANKLVLNHYRVDEPNRVYICVKYIDKQVADSARAEFALMFKDKPNMSLGYGSCE